MNKYNTLFVAFLVLAMPILVLAQEPTLTSTDKVLKEEAAETEETGLDGDNEVEISKSSTRPRLHAIGVLGKGIAVNPSDAMDFMTVKLGLGAVEVTVDGEEKKAALGVLILDSDKYRLKSVSVVDGQATGDIYQNGSNVGSFDVSSVQKEDVEVWAGEMVLDGYTYHIYILEGSRRIRAQELKDKVADYCRNNPEDMNCRDKVEEFCGNNPNDARCKALFRRYCIAGRNMDDTRCRQYVKDYCSENLTLPECVTSAVKRAKAYCDEHPDSTVCKNIDERLVNFCQNNPDNAGCVRAKELLQNKQQVLSRIRNVVTKTIQEVKDQTPDPSSVLNNVDVVEGG